MRFALIVLAFAVVFVAASPSMDKKKKKTAPPVEAPVEETPAELGLGHSLATHAIVT
ncbi:hypothetical protein PC9H_009228 [Pleurotus ostreatus]|uniref:Uncharacterized protein n=1 Tax=Pleurotus ostreatus TaxID=5322 RepID=A0A8H6ZLC3_PLEOS|nr:uncharacterized protein PC9H_009228 [Pleurotus ostreatus]KAF7423930.1 hypothetical protein PC9H_009228 [Pleurotus ostreatus]